MNSDAKELGGSGQGNFGVVESRSTPWNGRRQSINVILPPLGAVFFRPEQ
jgi:1,4-alpha-glucan branching enzyme